MSALRATMRWAPTASESVSAGRRPDGTTATVTPTANRNPSDAGVPTSKAMRKNTTPTETAMSAMTREIRSSSRRSGVVGGRARRVRPAIPASRVSAPVARTMASPSPSTTKLPPKSASPTSGCSERLSPVNDETSMASECTTSRVQSAESWSPPASRTRSPMTRSSAAITSSCPSRRTVARRGIIERNRSAACSARRCSKNANSALIVITTITATPSCGIPAMKASAAATQKSAAKKWVNSARR
ncbi:unannotated protein [freshwater metagenome]|uniref:Unannotated protein n=1 Tax=freshwater metagenome TaxID=449393 RepID=A0A6J5YH70_9ZZZZ